MNNINFIIIIIIIKLLKTYAYYKLEEMTSGKLFLSIMIQLLEHNIINTYLLFLLLKCISYINQAVRVGLFYLFSLFTKG
jgi:hypothetical protein